MQAKVSQSYMVYVSFFTVFIPVTSVMGTRALCSGSSIHFDTDGFSVSGSIDTSTRSGGGSSSSKCESMFSSYIELLSHSSF